MSVFLWFTLSIYWQYTLGDWCAEGGLINPLVSPLGSGIPTMFMYVNSRHEKGYNDTHFYSDNGPNVYIYVWERERESIYTVWSKIIVPKRFIWKGHLRSFYPYIPQKWIYSWGWPIFCGFWILKIRPQMKIL